MYGQVRSLKEEEIVGELVELEMGSRGVSILKIEKDMLLSKSKVARGHQLFAQANSLAVAVIDTEIALTAVSYTHLDVYKRQRASYIFCIYIS